MFQRSFALFLLALLFCMPTTVKAQYASGGSGAYRGDIFWFDWGTAPTDIVPNAQGSYSLTNTVNVGSRAVSVTCTLSNITGGTAPSLQIYRPGGWWQDGLDNLYNIGGLGKTNPDGVSGTNNNTMDIGLRNRSNPSPEVSFNFACTATIDGAPRILDGLVFADAEALSATEYIEATIPAGSVYRTIERFRDPSCSNAYQVAQAGSTYRFTSPNGACSATGGPMAIGFIDGASSARVRLKGDGVTAVALGVLIVGYDYGDAPLSYGNASHQNQGGWAGGVVTGTQNIFDGGYTLATRNSPLIIGATKDTEGVQAYSATANGDDIAGNDDEDGVVIASLPRLTTVSTGNYDVPVSCSGAGALRGWIDFDMSGDFNTSTEASVPTTCSSGTATLRFSVPAAIRAGSSFLRVRFALNAADVTNPTGIADTGEVEDHSLPSTCCSD